MTTSLRIGLASLAGLMLITLTVWGRSEETKRSEDKGREVASDDTSAPVYNPPLRGTPGGRVGGGTRGSRPDILALSVLAPDHTGQTTKAQPSLFWFISSGTTLPVELTIVNLDPKLDLDPKAKAVVIELPIPGPIERGVHRVRLADYGVTLAPGTAYLWSVAVVPDPARRSRDILASGTIELIETDGELARKLAAAQGQELVSRYARAGIWYDALEAVNDLIERSPSDPTPRRNRAALLTQIGLSEAVQ